MNLAPHHVYNASTRMGTPFEEYLLQQGLISQHTLGNALQKQALDTCALDTAILETGMIDESQLLEALSVANPRRVMDLRDVEPSQKAKEFLPLRLAEKLTCVPLAFDEGILHLACTYPLAEDSLKKIEVLLKTPIKAWVSLECRIRDWQKKMYGLDLPQRFQTLLDTLHARKKPAPDDDWLGAQPIEVAVETTQWSLDEARSQLALAAHQLQQLLDTTLQFAQQTFHYVAAFSVQDGLAFLQAHRGFSPNASEPAGFSLPLDAPSVFRTVTQSRGSYVGPAPADEWTKHYLTALGRNPRFVFLFPIEVRGKVVALLYGDNGNTPIRQRLFAELLLFCQELSGAFEECILARKGRETPSKSFASRALRKVRKPVGAMDFESLFLQLTGPDVQRRAEALQEFTLAPEASANFIASRFPGPTSWPLVVVSELPSAEELGPLPAALTWLGKPGAAALAPLLSSDDSETRYLALLTAGNMPSPELLEGVMRATFDLEPEVASAARVAASAFVEMPRFESFAQQLREALDSAVPLRKTLAIRALGALRDVASIEALITLTSDETTRVAQASAEALKDITKMSFGAHSQPWMAWWKQNQHRPRHEWLIAALRHPDFDIRKSAIEDLSAKSRDTLGYTPDGPVSEREAAISRWEMSFREDSAHW